MDLITIKDWEEIYYFLLKTGSVDNMDDYIDTVMKELENIIPYYAANFFTYNNEELEGGLKKVNIPDRAIEDYQEYYYKIDDIKLKTFNQKEAIISTDVMDYKRWINTEYFNDFLLKNNLYYSCGVDIHYKNIILGTIGLFRESTDLNYNQKDLLILEILKKQLANQMFKLNTIEKMIKSKDNNLSQKLEMSETIYNLTDRECEIVNYVINGKNNKQLADELFISINTVKKHLNNIYKKMKVNNRTELTYLIFNID